jgi:hypothetical protein
MNGGKIKIVLDADVIIHFAKGGLLSFLPSIFPEYEYVLLDNLSHHDRLSLARLAQADAYDRRGAGIHRRSEIKG